MIEKVVNTVKKLGLEMVLNANSGHTGIILSASPILVGIYAEANFNPDDPKWINRDRVVLSGGHGSAMLYATLHLLGFAISIEDLYKFRKLGSLLPGHPEITTPGVDANTGALGQGFCNAVGMAAAEAFLAARYNEKNLTLFNHYTYALVGDGDIMEGICYEAASFAGQNKLNKLIVCYDCNNVSLDGKTDITTNEDIKGRFLAVGWNVLDVPECYSAQKVQSAIVAAKNSDKPTLIVCHTILGYGSPFAGNEKSHSNPFTTISAENFIKSLNLSIDKFKVDNDVYSFCKKLVAVKQKNYSAWNSIKAKYILKHRNKYKELTNYNNNIAQNAILKTKVVTDLATRDMSHMLLNVWAKAQNNLIGGAADVRNVTKAFIDDENYFSATNYAQRNIAYGLREHAMGAIANGIALHGGVRTFTSTMLVFSDYMKYSIRMAAIMNLPIVYVFSHDSIFVGEDGVTHQPVEQIEGLRLIPNLNVVRPADFTETQGAYCLAIESKNPTAIILTRQKVRNLQGTQIEGVMKGGYVLSYEKDLKELNGILIATGSELSLALSAQRIMQDDGLSIRVVSMPCRELFLRQDKKYIDKILPPKNRARLVIEAGSTSGWYKIVGTDGDVIGVDRFGMSGSGFEVANLMGINLPNIIAKMDKLMKQNATLVDSII